MATCYGGMGDTSMENPETQGVHSNRKNYQEKIFSTINLQKGVINSNCRR